MPQKKTFFVLVIIVFFVMQIMKFLLNLIIACLLLVACASQEKINKSWEAKLASDVEQMNKSDFLYKNAPQNLKLYAFCEKNNDGIIFRYPCDLDSTYIANILNRVYYFDSTKGLKFVVQSLYYAPYVIDHPQNAYGDSVPSLFRYHTEKSGIKIKKDGGMQSYCATSDGEKCSYLFAEISAQKQLTETRNYSEFYDMFVDSSFETSFSMKKTLDDLSDFIYALNVRFKSDKKFLVPYDVCWQEDGTFAPCDLDFATKQAIADFVSKVEGGTLKMVTYRGNRIFKAAYEEAVLEKHVCESTDGEKCEKAWFLVDSPKGAREFTIDLKKNTINEIVDSEYVEDFVWRCGWCYYDENGTIKKNYDESGQKEYDLKYFMK